MQCCKGRKGLGGDMARGRMINETVATDKRLNSLSIEAELIYLKTIPHLDRDGLILGEPQLLWGQVCRRRPELRDAMDRIVAEWIEIGLVIQYEGDEDPILFFVGFAKNQQGLRYDRESASKYPPPPGWKRGDDGLSPEEIPPAPPPPPTLSDIPTEGVRQSDGVSPAEWNGSLSEENTHAHAAAPTAPANTRRDVTHRQAQRRMGNSAGAYPDCKPEVLTHLTNCVKRIYRYDALIDDPGDDKLEDKLRREAYRLWQRGYTTEAEMDMLGIAWVKRAEGFHDKRPYGDQLYELAISLRSRIVDNDSSVVDFAIEDTL